MDESYRALLGQRSARRLLAALCAAWLSFGIVGLAVFLAARGATGSDGQAGVVVAAFSAGSGLLAPLRGRLVDRHGVLPWLPLLAAGYSVSLGSFALLAGSGAGAWPLAACAVAAGASAPPLVGTARSLWIEAVEESLVRRAYALTSLIGDVGLVVAPAISGLLFVLVDWSPLALAATAALLAVALLVRATSVHSRDAGAESVEIRPGPAPAGASLLRDGAMRTILLVSIALGAALGLVEVAVPAAAARWGEEGLSGPLLAAFAGGSVVGGLWFGRRDWKAPARSRYLGAVAVLAVALAPPALAGGPATLAPLLVVAGLGYGPATISLFEALDLVAPSRAIEAFTWVTTAEALGAAAGAAASGWSVESIGTWAPFVIGSGVLLVVAGPALVGARVGTASPRGSRPGR